MHGQTSVGEQGGRGCAPAAGHDDGSTDLPGKPPGGSRTSGLDAATSTCGSASAGSVPALHEDAAGRAVSRWEGISPPPPDRASTDARGQLAAVTSPSPRAGSGDGQGEQSRFHRPPGKSAPAPGKSLAPAGRRWPPQGSVLARHGAAGRCQPAKRRAQARVLLQGSCAQTWHSAPCGNRARAGGSPRANGCASCCHAAISPER